MKLSKLRYIGVITAVLFVASSCKDGFEEINKPWDKDVSASVSQVYNGLVSTMVMGWQERVTYNSWVYPVTQQGMITASSGYVMANAASELWNNYYYALGNYRLLEQKIEESADKAKLTNVRAMARTLMAYKTLKVTEFFGDIPYSDAGKAATDGSAAYRAKYDTQQQVYTAALADLKWAVDNFSTSSDQISIGAYETFFKGDIAKWTKFANSLRLKYAIRISSKDQATAATAITEALAKPLLADGENYGIDPGQIANLVLAGRPWSNTGVFHRMSSTVWSWLSSTNAKDGSGIFDPRAKVFFEANGKNEWNPYPVNPGASTPIEAGGVYTPEMVYSPFNKALSQDETYMPELMVTAAEIHFIKAEVYTRGIGATKNLTTAKDEYEKGIKASVNYWVQLLISSPYIPYWPASKPTALPTTAQINALLAAPKVAFNTASEDTALRQIYAQMWLDYYSQPWDAWTLKRRTGGKTPTETTTATWETIHRFTYPDSESSYNAANWRAATGGSDLITTKTWLEQ